MAIFTQDNNSCYFIHIPRTGGRYVSSLFESVSNINCEHHKIHQKRIYGIDVTHLHYPLYNDLLHVNDLPHITVVRNPFDKFNSCIANMHKIHEIDYNLKLNSYENFLDFVNIEISIQSYHNNWFLPQNMFVSPKTHIWKYEWGFDKKFVTWVFNKTKIKLTLQDVNYEKFDGETKEKYILDGRIKNYIKKFYKKDYKKFKYFW